MPDQQPNPQADPQAQRPTWWCNFCGYTTDDEQAYLEHSCVDELARQEASASPQGQPPTAV